METERKSSARIRSVYRDDRGDRYSAATLSLALHMALVAWLISEPLDVSSGRSEGMLSSGNLAMEMLGKDEFRQPLVVAATIPPTPSPTLQPEVTDLVDAQEIADTIAVAPSRSEQSSPSMEMPPAADAGGSTAQSAGQIASQHVAQENFIHHDAREQAYLMALREAIRSKWTQQYGPCSVTIRQTVGGHVVDAASSSCAMAESDRRALEAAVLAAQPLPYAGFERVFRDQVTVEMGN